MPESAIDLTPPATFPHYGRFLRSMQRQNAWWALTKYDEERQLGEAWYRIVGSKVARKSIVMPDVSFMFKGRVRREYWYVGMDLVMEFFGESLEEWCHFMYERTRLYAGAKVPEFWLADFALKRITVLKLNERTMAYDVHGQYHEGQKARSRVLKGFQMDVKECMEGDRRKKK